MDDELELEGLQEPEEGSYVCESCGEDIVIPLDITAGREQEYVEDCPVCCNANIIRVTLEENGNISVSACSE